VAAGPRFVAIFEDKERIDVQRSVLGDHGIEPIILVRALGDVVSITEPHVSVLPWGQADRLWKSDSRRWFHVSVNIQMRMDRWAE
jgi:hypothetical protein